MLESRTARSGVSHRVEVLDKVKALALSADGVHATTRDVAEYFEVGESVVNNLLGRHRQELRSNGLRVLKGAELREFVNLKTRFTSGNANSYPQTQRHLAVYTRRTILNVAMLLRDSEIARRVRSYLLDVEASTRTTAVPAETARYESLDRRVSDLETAVSHIGPVLQELGPVIGRMSVRLERMDRRLEEMDRRLVNTERVVGAMSQRMAQWAPDREADDEAVDG
nr:hypothetical protein [Streptomyces sp. HNM0575]